MNDCNGATAGYGSWRWKLVTHAARTRLRAARAAPVPSSYGESEVKHLLILVQRYYRAVLREGQPMIAAASVRHGGTFNRGATGVQWNRSTADQRVTPCPPGFVWNARIGMMPGVLVRVHDVYIGGERLVHGDLRGLVPVVNIAGTTEVARGEFIRLFAEAVWYPTALLPSQGRARGCRQ